MEKTYVIAGNYREFCTWCQDMLVSKSSPLVYYIEEFGGPRVLRGLRGANIICIGTYRSRKDYDELSAVVREAVSPEIKIVYKRVEVEPMKETTSPADGGRKVLWEEAA